VEAGEAILFENDDPSALLREQRGDGRPGRAAADNENIAFLAVWRRWHSVSS
jgi:hypothetical protein